MGETITRGEIFEGVRDILVDALAVDDVEVVPSASLTGDLGAESIDFLDIVFKIEQRFKFKISNGELFPDNVANNPDFVHGGMVTPRGLALLKERMPHVDFSSLESDPQVGRVAGVFTVDALVNFVERKIRSA